MPAFRRATVIERLEAATVTRLIETTDGILQELLAQFSDTELQALAGGLGTLAYMRSETQAAAVDRFEAALQSIQHGACYALKGQGAMTDFSQLTDEQKNELARRYAVARWAFDLPPVDTAQSEAQRLSAVYGVNITPEQAAELLSKRTVQP